LTQKRNFEHRKIGIFFQRLNALGPLAVDTKKDGNMRTAISAEATRKVPGVKLPVIPKTAQERECIENALYENAFMRNLSRDQFSQVSTEKILIIKKLKSFH